MERLTNVQGLCIECIDCNEKFDCEAECNAIDDCIKKLAAYEDTGLTPEQVRELAEEQQYHRWIPVEERLPEFNAFNPITRDAYVYPVTIDLGGITDIRYYSFWKGHWYNQGPKIMDDLVIAWQPLPEPYKPEKEE